LLLSIWYAHEFRLAQIARQLNVRFEERLAERTRIAQELHDTLLQGIAGASMHLHVAAEHVPGGSPLAEPLGRALDSLSCVVREGRDAVLGLRLHQRNEVELDQAFSRIPQDLAVRDRTAYRVVVEGHPLPLHPMVRDEVYSIGREAVINAFRHSAATEIMVAIEYSRDCLCLSIRDDGCGIDPQILKSGRPGHWGLLGMRERAERIEAQFVVKSYAARGTEIRLSIPGRTAFSRGPDNARTRWFGRQMLRGEGSKGRTSVGVNPGERD
jgi:signal transduction histidine kinase